MADYVPNFEIPYFFHPKVQFQLSPQVFKIKSANSWIFFKSNYKKNFNFVMILDEHMSTTASCRKDLHLACMCICFGSDSKEDTTYF